MDPRERAQAMARRVTPLAPPVRLRKIAPGSSSHRELGQAVLDRVSTQLADIAKIESAGRLEGKSMTMILTPK